MSVAYGPRKRDCTNCECIWIPEHWLTVVAHCELCDCAGISLFSNFDLHEREKLRSLHYCWLVRSSVWLPVAYVFMTFSSLLRATSENWMVAIAPQPKKKQRRRRRNLLISFFLQRSTKFNSIRKSVIVCIRVCFYSGSKDTILTQVVIRVTIEIQKKKK